MFVDLTYLVVVVLVPVIPAFLLYKFLPEGKTTVGGPFRGLDIKLSGAFAGYFLVLLIAISLIVFLIKQKPQQYEVYTVRGKVDLQKTGNQQPQFDYRQLSFSLEPSQQQVLPDGSFTIEIPVERKQNGELDFPTLSVEYADPQNKSEPYEAGTIHLAVDFPYEQDFKLTHDSQAKTIDVKPAVVLAKRPYNQNAAAQPLSLQA